MSCFGRTGPIGEGVHVHTGIALPYYLTYNSRAVCLGFVYILDIRTPNCQLKLGDNLNVIPLGGYTASQFGVSSASVVDSRCGEGGCIQADMY
jgi:hypothetical protein